MYYKTEKDENGKYTTVKSEAPIDVSDGGGGNVYAWVHWSGTVLYLNCDVSPNDPNTIRSISKDDLKIENFWNDEYMSAYNVSSDTSFSYIVDNREMVLNRDPTKDFNIWDVDVSALHIEKIAYCWQNQSSESLLWYDFDYAPEDTDGYNAAYAAWVINDGSIKVSSDNKPWGTYEKISDDEFTLTDERAGETSHFVRTFDKDFALWE